MLLLLLSFSGHFRKDALKQCSLASLTLGYSVSHPEPFDNGINVEQG